MKMNFFLVYLLQLLESLHLFRTLLSLKITSVQYVIDNVNSINLILQKMLLNKSSSLPQIKVNFNKFDNFFSAKGNHNLPPLDEQYLHPEQTTSTQDNTQSKIYSQTTNMNNYKSSLKTRVQTYLNDGRKMGILDHNNNQTSNRRSLTRISLQSMKPIKTQAQQQKAYLTQLKDQLNQFFQKNQRTERQIKNTTALHNQVKQKIIFYQQLLSRTWIHRYQLLNQREQNLVYIRYESDRLKFMFDRLKQINILLKKKVKDAQENLRLTSNEATTLNEVEGIRQNQLDQKEYLLKHYENFEAAKTERLSYQSTSAISKMQINEATQILKKHHSSIRIMEHDDYTNQMLQVGHQKAVRQIQVQKFTSKLLDSMWTKYSSYYESYQKAQQLIKMYCMDRDMLVQDSYRKSFVVKQELQKKIAEKEKRLQELQKKNTMLRSSYQAHNFDQIQEIQKRLSQIKKQILIGKIKEEDQKLKEQYVYQKSIRHRATEAEKSKHMLIRLKEWIVKQQKKLQSSISKKASLNQHFVSLINSVFNELKQKEATYDFLQANKTQQKKVVSKTNKFGNNRRKK